MCNLLSTNNNVIFYYYKLRSEATIMAMPMTVREYTIYRGVVAYKVYRPSLNHFWPHDNNYLVWIIILYRDIVNSSGL